MADVMMPRLSDTMEEGVLSLWLKHEGDPVHKGDTLAEIETDKATMELEAYEDGVLERLLVAEGTTVPIGQVIAVIGDGSGTGAASGDQGAGTTGAQAPGTEQAATAGAPGAEAGTAPAGTAQPAAGSAQPVAGAAPPTAAAAATAAPAVGPTGPVRTSPLARRLAREHGLDLAAIVGTGPGGRIVRADVEAAIAAPPTRPDAAPAGTAAAPAVPAPAPGAVAAPVAAPREGDEVIPLSSIRRITAERLTQSAMSPQFYLTSVVEVDRLLQVRAEVNAGLAATATEDEPAVKVSVTDLLVRVCALTLRAHPEVNASWGGNAVLRHRDINVGVAVAVDEGLLVPVIRGADQLGLAEIATRSRDLAQRARKGRLKPDEFTGGTFTISNLGMFDVDHFTAVVNPPEAAILAVGAGTQMPVVRDGEVVVRMIIKLTLTSDHRVLDGATSAAFLRDLKRGLENPLAVLL